MMNDIVINCNKHTQGFFSVQSNTEYAALRGFEV